MPRSAEIYVFGSVLRSLEPNDLDILVIYDSKIYPKANIYIACKKMIDILAKTFNLDVHLTVLNYSENNEMNFVKNVKAIKLKSFLQNKLLK
ncbi:nucleotidyltransferase domain-containing protein [Clostridium botulinum]|uniref:nucleotidyltransferase domain-containing protein n=1 Tax=Clostridium botulinum TaxID=1491 RepID=UPI001F1C8F36|nr:nucleotidyltransferase domain-containing protein [Clostridium botulinum]